MVYEIIVQMMVVLCIGISAGAKAKELQREELQRRYLAQKETVVSEVREFLAKQGFSNSGVTNTRREWGENEEEWILSVHHGRIERMAENARQEMAEAIEEIVAEAKPEVGVRVILK